MSTGTVGEEDGQGRGRLLKREIVVTVKGLALALELGLGNIIHYRSQR